MKYQSIIIESSSANISYIKQVLKEEFNISELKDININVIKKPDEKESIGIGDVSNLAEWAYSKNQDLRVLIIENANLLTDQAQNSLLKLVEEPPENILIVLVSINSNSILPTILSRCLTIKGENIYEDGYQMNDIIKFISSNYLERSRIIDRMFSEDLKRGKAAGFIEGILKLKLDKKDVKNIEEIQNAYRGVKRGVNLKLCFDYLNTLLE